MHVVTNLKNTNKLKDRIKDELKEHGISHTTIEFEEKNFECNEVNCVIKENKVSHHHHHH